MLKVHEVGNVDRAEGVAVENNLGEQLVAAQVNSADLVVHVQANVLAVRIAVGKERCDVAIDGHIGADGVLVEIVGLASLYHIQLGLAAAPAHRHGGGDSCLHAKVEHGALLCCQLHLAGLLLKHHLHGRVVHGHEMCAVDSLAVHQHLLQAVALGRISHNPCRHAALGCGCQVSMLAVKGSCPLCEVKLAVLCGIACERIVLVGRRFVAEIVFLAGVCGVDGEVDVLLGGRAVACDVDLPKIIVACYVVSVALLGSGTAFDEERC